MKVDGITYKSPCSVVLGVENDYPVFGHLQGLYVLNNNNISLHVRVADTIMFEQHHHAYVVKSTDTFKTVHIHQLYSQWPLHCRKSEDDKQMIIVKHHILGTI